MIGRKRRNRRFARGNKHFFRNGKRVAAADADDRDAAFPGRRGYRGYIGIFHTLRLFCLSFFIIPIIS